LPGIRATDNHCFKRFYLGTTNSLVAYLDNGEPKLIPNALGEVLTPSVVGLGDDGALIVGQTAKHRLVSHPDQTVGLFKRKMGTDSVMKLGRNESTHQ